MVRYSKVRFDLLRDGKSIPIIDFNLGVLQLVPSDQKFGSTNQAELRLLFNLQVAMILRLLPDFKSLGERSTSVVKFSISSSVTSDSLISLEIIALPVSSSSCCPPILSSSAICCLFSSL